MKTSNVIGFAAVAAFLTLVELGVGAAILSCPANVTSEARLQLQQPTRFATLEPVVVIGRSD